MSLAATVLSKAGPSSVAAVDDEKRRASSLGGTRYAIGTNRDLSQTAQDFDVANTNVLVVYSADYAYAQAVKARKPGIQIGAYKDFGAMRASLFTDGTSSTGVPLGQAQPSWQLYNGSTALYLSAYPLLFVADVGLDAYIDAFDALSGPEVKARGFDFIFCDDVNPYLHTQLASDKYPTDADYQAAVTYGIQRLATKLKARGLWTLPNLGAWHDPNVVNAQTWGNAIAQAVGAGFHEQWASFGYPPTIQGRLSMDNMVASAFALNKAGGRHVSVSHGTSSDTAVARLALALELLGMYGYRRACTGMMADANYEQLPAHLAAAPADYAAAALLGPPLGDPLQSPAHVWSRQFLGGQVWVNTDTVTHAVTFGGTYSGSGLTSQTGTTLAANGSALILTPG